MDQQDKHISRRDFLKVAGTAARIWVLRYAGIKIYDWIDKNKVQFFGRIPEKNEIISEIPPTLSKLEIPEKNERLRQPHEILGEAFGFYEGWRKQNQSLPPLQYNKPVNYLDIGSAVTNLANDERIQKTIGKGEMPHMGQLMGVLQEMDNVPYSSYISYSQENIQGIQSLLEVDPGTGIVQKINHGLKVKSGDAFDVKNRARAGELTSEQMDYIEQSIEEWDSGAKDYVAKVRQTNGGNLISTSVVGAYFLYINKGDVMKGIWDTSLWFKLQARNDIPNLKYNPDKTKAKYLAEHFVDEISPNVSINWLNDNVQNVDELWTSDRDLNQQWKDYMPINRVGEYYYLWNIFGLGGVMTEPFLRRSISAWASSSFTNEIPYLHHHGSEKIAAINLLLQDADKFTRLYKHFEPNNNYLAK